MNHFIGCTGCAYRRYVGEGRSMCTHQAAQITVLQHTGKIEMTPKQYIQRCAYASVDLDRKQVGAENPEMLRKLQATSTATRKKDPSKQTSLF